MAAGVGSTDPVSINYDCSYVVRLTRFWTWNFWFQKTTVEHLEQWLRIKPFWNDHLLGQIRSDVMAIKET